MNWFFRINLGMNPFNIFLIDLFQRKIVQVRMQKFWPMKLWRRQLGGAATDFMSSLPPFYLLLHKSQFCQQTYLGRREWMPENRQYTTWRHCSQPLLALHLFEEENTICGEMCLHLLKGFRPQVRHFMGIRKIGVEIIISLLLLNEAHDYEVRHWKCLIFWGED